jgi:DNA mismatch endonuclease (patch repair protein)
VAVFCDGDFWHGRELDERIHKLGRGHNAPYWVAKISSNVARDRRHDEALERDGWLVLRFWETEIARDPAAVAARVAEAVSRRR